MSQKCCQPLEMGTIKIVGSKIITKARNEALAEMEQRAAAVGANAVVGVDIDYEVLGADNGMLMVSASGTAVVVD